MDIVEGFRFKINTMKDAIKILNLTPSRFVNCFFHHFFDDFLKKWKYYGYG